VTFPTVREAGSLEALQATMEPADAHLGGAALQHAALRGAMRRLVVVRLAGEVAVAVKLQVGVEVADARPMEAMMAIVLLMVAAATEAGLPMAVQRHMGERHHMAEQQPTAAMMVHAPHMEVSTLAAVHLDGEAHRAMRPRSQVVFLLLLQVHTTRPRQVLTRLRLLERMAGTQHPRQAAHPWTHRRLVTFLLLHLEIPATSMELRQPLHRRQAHGANQRRQLRVGRIQATIEAPSRGIVRVSFSLTQSCRDCKSD